MAYDREDSKTHERLSAVESDVRHLDARLGTLDRNMQENFAGLRNLLNQQKQPVTAFAGWASVILALVFAFGAPLKSADGRLRDRIDFIERRELTDSYARGVSDQRFSTLEEHIDSAVVNRKELHNSLKQELYTLREQFNDLSHTLDSGLGRRITEKTEDIRSDIRWIMLRLDELHQSQQ